MNRPRALIVAFAVGFCLSLAPGLPAQDEPAAAGPAPRSDLEKRAQEAFDEAEKLFRQDKMEAGAAVLLKAADELGPSPTADYMRFGAINALAFGFVTQDKGQDRLQGLADEFLAKSSAELREQAHLGAASVFILCANYTRATEILDAYLKHYPAPTEEELAKFKQELEKAGMGEEARRQTEHPRLTGRTAAERMLKSIGLVGKEAPHFELETLDGQKVSPRDFRGRVLLLDFWATWCAPCRKELPNLKKDYEQYHGQGLEILSMSLDRDKEKLTAFLQAEGIAWKQVYVDQKVEQLAELYVFDGIPATFVVDRQGIVRARDLRGSRLTSTIDRLIREGRGEQPGGAP